MTTTAAEQVSGADAEVLVPRQPTIDFLRSMMDLLGELATTEPDPKRVNLIARIRNEHRSHLAAFLLLADSDHQAYVAALRASLAQGADLGPSMTLEEFDRAYPAK